MARFTSIVLLIFLFTLTGCVNKKLAVISQGLKDGRYDSEFPTANASREIERITHSVKKIYCVSTYTTYQFTREAKITGYQLRQGNYRNKAWAVVTTSETMFGTATLIGYDGKHATLLTCAHILDSPDTLIEYHEAPDDVPQFYIKSISLMGKQENWVKELGSLGPFPILASDLESDIAILGKQIESPADTILPFPYPSGKASELEWGSFVYVLGYPHGNLVVTKGIVSILPERSTYSFTLDALLNKGFSGGIILAIRDGVPNFELVGMIKNVNSSREQTLKPEKSDRPYVEYLPYTGTIYPGTDEAIHYGLNSVVPFETIRGFYLKNRDYLHRQGFDLDGFFKVEEP